MKAAHEIKDYITTSNVANILKFSRLWEESTTNSSCKTKLFLAGSVFTIQFTRHEPNFSLYCKLTDDDAYVINTDSAILIIWQCKFVPYIVENHIRKLQRTPFKFPLEKNVYEILCQKFWTKWTEWTSLTEFFPKNLLHHSSKEMLSHGNYYKTIQLQEVCSYFHSFEKMLLL